MDLREKSYLKFNSIFNKRDHADQKQSTHGLNKLT